MVVGARSVPLRKGDEHECPRLFVGAGRCLTRGTDAVEDGVARHGVRREVAHRSSRLHLVQKLGGTGAHVARRAAVESERNGAEAGWDELDWVMTRL